MGETSINLFYGQLDDTKCCKRESRDLEGEVKEERIDEFNMNFPELYTWFMI